MASAGKIHVVFIVENLSVPFDRRVWREAKALKRNGFQVSVISPKGLNTDRNSLENIDGITIFRYSIPLTQNSQFGYFKEYGKAFASVLWLLFKIHAKQKINAIHVANPPEIFFPLGWLSKILKIKFIFDHHDLSPESYLFKFKKGKSNLMYRLLLAMEKLTFQTADFVIATNESIKEIAITRGKIPENKIAIVRNGPDSSFQPIVPKSHLKNGRKFLAAYVGVMGTTDGVENIIHAAQLIIKEKSYKHIHFILIGFGDEYENHLKIIDQFDLGEFISMPGRLSDQEVIEILSTADVCLAPDPANGVNEFHTMNKIMDYMRCAKPIVSFDLRESKYSADKAAVYVKDNNVREFANAILDLLEKPSLRRQMGEFGKEKVEKELKWEYSENILVKTYKSMFRTHVADQCGGAL